MNLIKRLTQFIKRHYILAKNRLHIGVMLIKVLIPLHFINPRNWFRKVQLTPNQKLLKSVDDLKPLLIKFGQTLSTRENISKIIGKLHENVPLAANEQTITNIVQDNKHSTDETTVETNNTQESIFTANQESVTSKENDIGQQVKNLFNELNIAQFTGDKVALHLGSLINKGMEYKEQFSGSIQQTIAEYLHEELQGFTSRKELSDFISEIDELSLNVEQLQAQVNQLMSSHEIN